MGTPWLFGEETPFYFSSACTGEDHVRPSGSAEDWYVTLNVAPDARPAEIRSAYLAAISNYHPDRVASLGLKLRELAKRESQAINAAYAEAQRVRKF